jgi:diadenosine tetraphosphate (Ap4A) HIT family hydrolase
MGRTLDGFATLAMTDGADANASIDNAMIALDSRLAADTAPICELPLCRVLLMRDARYPWLILVPRRDGLTELDDLTQEDAAQLMREIVMATRVMRGFAGVEKVNVGALGNIVRQLHMHIVGRRAGDYAWPGPVWGAGRPSAYDPAELAARLVHFADRLK